MPMPMPLRERNPLFYNAVRELGRFKIDGVYCRLIPLTQGQWAIVEEGDFEWLMQWKWWSGSSKKNPKVYACRSVRDNGRNRHIKMHREVLGLNGAPKSVLVDHIDHLATTDNRRKNLRPATKAQNMGNTPHRKSNTTGFKGVTWNNLQKRFVAHIKIDGKTKFLGSSKIAARAHLLYQKAADEKYGEFARY